MASMLHQLVLLRFFVTRCGEWASRASSWCCRCCVWCSRGRYFSITCVWCREAGYGLSSSPLIINHVEVLEIFWRRRRDHQVKAVEDLSSSILNMLDRAGILCVALGRAELLCVALLYSSTIRYRYLQLRIWTMLSKFHHCGSEHSVLLCLFVFHHITLLVRSRSVFCFWLRCLRNAHSDQWITVQAPSPRCLLLFRYIHVVMLFN